MELKDIAAVSGKPGLYQVLKPTRTGLILESLDGNNTKLVTGPHHRVSLLHEISIYTMDFDTTIPLQEIFSTIHKEFGDDPGVDGKSDPDELRAFMEHIAPDYDKERVYVSDMKKLVTWYGILLKAAPEILAEKEENKGESKEVVTEKEKKAEDKIEDPSESKIVSKNQEILRKKTSDQ
jgi:hypothetical protein